MTTSNGTSRKRQALPGGTSLAPDKAGGSSLAGVGDDPLNVNRTPADVGTSNKAARADHKHDVDVAAPVDVGQANAEGTSSSLARADHVHDHGNQPLGDGLDHAVATNTIAGFMSPADKGKIDALVGVEDEGVALPGVYTRFNFTGNGISALNAGGGEATISVPFVSNGILISDEGVNLGGFDRINAVGPGFDATNAGGGQADFTISTAVPVSVAQANAEGTADDLARADHVHDHGNQPLGDGLDHALATPNPGGVAGFMSPDDKKLLDDLEDAGAGPPILVFGQESLPNQRQSYIAPGFDRSAAQPIATGTPAVMVSPRAGRLQNLYVIHNKPTSPQTRNITYEVYHASGPHPRTLVPTGISVTVASGSGIEVADLVNTFTVAAGDWIQIIADPRGPGPNFSLDVHVILSLEHAGIYP